jgi:hypothetical protein
MAAVLRKAPDTYPAPSSFLRTRTVIAYGDAGALVPESPDRNQGDTMDDMAQIRITY